MPELLKPEPLVVGNWKMNGTRDSVVNLTRNLLAELEELAIQVVACPPTLYVADVAGCIVENCIKDGTNIDADSHALQLGAQNICEYEDGAYTGEISGRMLREFGCQYVIVGHSERRQMYHETDEQIANKLVAAQSSGLRPIVCVGETQSQREKGQTMEVVQQQLDAVIGRAGLPALTSAVIAYEPVWAIGTGQIATAETAQQVLSEVRDLLGTTGVSTQLLYGGSVTAENTEALMKELDINGLLVGGASLQADQFVKICKVAGLN